MQRIPENRAEAESAVEAAIDDLLSRSGREVERDPVTYAQAFRPLACFLYRDEILTRQPFPGDEQAMVRLLRDAASRSVDAIISPEAVDPLTPDVPHDEWWRLAPHGFKKLHITERNRIRDLLYKVIVEQELPYWFRRLKSTELPMYGRTSSARTKLRPAGPAGEGTMGKAESWNISRAEFRKLAADYADFTSVFDRSSSGAYIWQPLGFDRAGREDFNVAATRAALIDGVPPSVDPLFHWHEALIRSGAAVQSGAKVVYRDQDGNPLPVAERSVGLEIPRVLAASAEYCADQEQLALRIATQPTGRETEVDEQLRVAPKEIVDRYKCRPPGVSYEKLAGKIGINRDTMYAITKESRWVSDKTYKLVAGVCGCRPEDLHPRDLPRPDRRR